MTPFQALSNIASLVKNPPTLVAVIFLLVPFALWVVSLMSVTAKRSPAASEVSEVRAENGASAANTLTAPVRYEGEY